MGIILLFLAKRAIFWQNNLAYIKNKNQLKNNFVIILDLKLIVMVISLI